MSQLWKPDKTLAWIRKTYTSKSFSSQDLVARLGMSRQTAARLLRKFVSQGHIHRTGSTKASLYHIAKPSNRKPVEDHRKIVNLKGLREDLVYEEILRQWSGPNLPENTSRIFAYAFTEMLNNAIDHSKSLKAEIRVWVESGQIFFLIRDTGIGIFQNIKKSFGFYRDEDAVEHLLKGKQTTAPDAHSGQGIFFTSKKIINLN